MKKKDFKEMTIEELAVELESIQKEQFQLKFQKGSGKLESPSRIKDLRRNVARIKTFQNQIENKG